MEKRSRRRTRDLVTQAASQGLSENEIGCARISIMARSTNAPCKGRIQMRKTNPLQLLTFGLHRTAGPYRWVIRAILTVRRSLPVYPDKQTIPPPAGTSHMCQDATLAPTMPHRRADEQLRKIGDVSAAMYWSAADPTEYRSS
jgi:hypothetical protein